MIDDDLDDFLFFNDRLKNFSGLRCHYACDAITGIAMMTKHAPSAVVLDMNMPTVNGLECLAMIKAYPAIAHIPVIIFSTCISDELSIAAKNIGAACCLEKPKNLDGYDLIIMQILSIIKKNIAGK